jgi:CBS domain containing-hemolysin-like protein
MECFFGDAILYKVEKDCLEEDEKIAHFKVISMCNEVDVVNKFTDEYLSIDENFELALPLYLAKLFHPVVAVLLSVTFVLAFGEVIPQAICTRYRLYVGATFIGLVRVLMFICYPIAYPIGKVMDILLGHDDVLFWRAQLKALVSIHSEEAGKGGELTHDEATIISGALDLTLKTAEEAMTPI